MHGCRILVVYPLDSGYRYIIVEIKLPINLIVSAGDFIVPSRTLIPRVPIEQIFILF